MTRRISVVLASLTVLVLIAAPVVWALQTRHHMRNFRVVTEGRVYRSAIMTREGLQRAFHDYRIRAVLSLRDGDRPADLAEEEYCRKEEVRFYRLSPLNWDRDETGAAPIDANLAKYRAILDDPENYPLLIHCFAGIHRTGAYCAIYRMEKESWSNERAIAEMRANGYDTLDSDLDILDYLTTYQPISKRLGSVK